MRIFDFFTKWKQKHSVSVDAVKEQTKVVLERLGLRRVGHHDTDGYWVLAA